jgi:hypothetical protein
MHLQSLPGPAVACLLNGTLNTGAGFLKSVGRIITIICSHAWARLFTIADMWGRLTQRLVSS